MHCDDRRPVISGTVFSLLRMPLQLNFRSFRLTTRTSPPTPSFFVFSCDTSSVIVNGFTETSKP